MHHPAGAQVSPGGVAACGAAAAAGVVRGVRRSGARCGTAVIVRLSLAVGAVLRPVCCSSSPRNLLVTVACGPALPCGLPLKLCRQGNPPSAAVGKPDRSVVDECVTLCACRWILRGHRLQVVAALAPPIPTQWHLARQGLAVGATRRGMTDPLVSPSTLCCHGFFPCHLQPADALMLPSL